MRPKRSRVGLSMTPLPPRTATVTAPKYMLFPSFLDRYLAKVAFEGQQAHLPVSPVRRDNLTLPNETGQRFDIQIAGERVWVPARASSMSGMATGKRLSFRSSVSDFGTKPSLLYWHTCISALTDPNPTADFNPAIAPLKNYGPHPPRARSSLSQRQSPAPNFCCAKGAPRREFAMRMRMVILHLADQSSLGSPCTK